MPKNFIIGHFFAKKNKKNIRIHYANIKICKQYFYLFLKHVFAIQLSPKRLYPRRKHRGLQTRLFITRLKMNLCSLSPDTGGNRPPDDDGKPGRGFLRQSIIPIPDMISPYHACCRIGIILTETPQILLSCSVHSQVLS